MKIVIEISDRLIKKVKDYYVNPYEVDEICEAILDGTPLPEHHGDLIDRRELKKEVYTTTEWNGDIHRIIYEASIDDAPSVTPQRPKGKWKPLNYKDEMWGYVYKCSNCGHIDYENDYCPKCGARIESDKKLR